MDWQSTLIKVRDVFAMRAHYGWAHYISREVGKQITLLARLARWVDARLSRLTDARSAEFDRMHGTETFTRSQVPVVEGVSVEELSFGYGPVNQDFFREIIRAIPVDLSRYSFVDVGAGKGVALMLASEFDFERIVGVELSQELIDVGKLNVERYVKSTQRSLDPDWIQADFLTWPLPEENSIFFFNNPLPSEIALQAVQRLEEESARRGVRFIIVYRKAPRAVENYLMKSPFFRPLRLAPYWRVYSSPNVAIQ